MNKTKKKPIKMDLICSVGNDIRNWTKILFANKFQVDFKYIPRAIFVTTVVLLFTPFRIIEKIIFNRRVKKIKLKTPVFIIGHMRSGTTFLHYIMSKDEKFAYASTAETVFPWVFLTLNKFIKALIRAILPSKRPMDNMKLSEDMPQEEELGIANLCLYSPNNGAYFPRNLEKFYYRYSFFEDVSERIIKKWKKTYIYYLKKISFKNNEKIVLSKSLVNSGRIKQLIELFPDAKFIFIYRNPYKVFLSTKKLYKKFIFKHMAFQEIPDEKLEELILKLAKKGFNKYFEDKKMIKKGNLFEIKFEELVKEPVKNLEKIYKDLKIPGFEEAKPKFIEVANQYKDYKADKYEIEDSLKKRIYENFEAVFKEFNYPKD